MGTHGEETRKSFRNGDEGRGRGSQSPQLLPEARAKKAADVTSRRSIRIASRAPGTN